MHANIVPASPVHPTARPVELHGSPGLAVNAGSLSPRGDVSPAAPHLTAFAAYQASRATRGNSFRSSVGSTVVNVSQIPTALPATGSLTPIVNGRVPVALPVHIPTALQATSSPNLSVSSPRVSISSPRLSASSLKPLEPVASLPSRLHSNMTTVHSFTSQFYQANTSPSTIDVQKVCDMTPVRSVGSRGCSPVRSHGYSPVRSHGCSPVRSPGRSPTNMLITQVPALDLDVSGITSDEPSHLVTFDGATDPIFFTKSESTVNANSVIIENPPAPGVPVTTRHDSPSVASEQSHFRGIPGSSRLRTRSASPSPVLASVNRNAPDSDDPNLEISQVTISPTHDSPIPAIAERPYPSNPSSPRKADNSIKIGSESTWAALGLTQSRPWVPAITSPTYFWRHDERKRGSSVVSVDSPPNSACSTPRRRRGNRFHHLHADAAERDRRRQERKESIESDNEMQLAISRESSCRATRRYKSSDTRTVLERTEDHMRRKAELAELAALEKKKKDEQELEGCTFKPALRHHRRPIKRVPDERELERHLRQLAHKQLDVKARLVQLEYEWLRSHAQWQERYAEKFKALQSEKKQEVFTLLGTSEGQKYYWDRVQLVSDTRSMTKPQAQSAVLTELLEDQRLMVQKIVTEEVDDEFQFPGRNLDFWTRRNVLIESLEAIETRASSSLQILANMESGFAIIKASGFTDGLAKQTKDNPPDPSRAELKDRDRLGSAGSVETISTTRTRGVISGTASHTTVRDAPLALLGVEPPSRHGSTVTSVSRFSQQSIVSETLQRTAQPPVAHTLSTSATRVVSASRIPTGHSTPSMSPIQVSAVVPPQAAIPQAHLLTPSNSAVPVARQISAGSDFAPSGQQVITRKSVGGDSAYSMEQIVTCMTPRRR